MDWSKSYDKSTQIDPHERAPKFPCPKLCAIIDSLFSTNNDTNKRIQNRDVTGIQDMLHPTQGGPTYPILFKIYFEDHSKRLKQEARDPGQLVIKPIKFVPHNVILLRAE